MTAINLKEYSVVLDGGNMESGYVLIQHNVRKNVLKARYQDVAGFYGIEDLGDYFTATVEAGPSSEISAYNSSAVSIGPNTVGNNYKVSRESAQSEELDMNRCEKHSATLLRNTDTRLNVPNSSAGMSDPGEKLKDGTNMSWNQCQTRFLLEMYANSIACVGPMKKYPRKKDMWKDVAKAVSEKFSTSFSSTQTENRYKTVLKRTKFIMKNNNTSGTSRINDEYEPEMTQIIRTDDSIVPMVMLSQDKILLKDLVEDPFRMRNSSFSSLLSSPSSPVPSLFEASSSTPSLLESSDTNFSQMEPLDGTSTPTSASHRYKNVNERIIEKLIEERRKRAEEKENRTQRRDEEKLADKNRRHMEKLELQKQKIVLLKQKIQLQEKVLKKLENLENNINENK